MSEGSCCRQPAPSLCRLPWLRQVPASSSAILCLDNIRSMFNTSTGSHWLHVVASPLSPGSLLTCVPCLYLLILTLQQEAGGPWHLWQG